MTVELSTGELAEALAGLISLLAIQLVNPLGTLSVSKLAGEP